MNLSKTKSFLPRPHRIASSLAVTLAALGAGVAHAEDLVINGFQFPGQPDVNISLVGRTIGQTANPGSNPGGALQVYAGAFNVSVASGPSAGQSFIAFCADLFKYDHVGVPATNYAAGTLTAGFSAARESDFLKLASAHYASVVDATSSAAFQLATWEILYETAPSYTLAAGDFKAVGGAAASGGALATAESWLTGLSSVSNSGQYAATLYSVESGNQNIVALAPVPEPETWGMLLAGLGLMGFIGRRRSSLR